MTAVKFVYFSKYSTVKSGLFLFIYSHIELSQTKGTLGEQDTLDIFGEVKMNS